MIRALVCLLSLAAVAAACLWVFPLLRARNKRLLALRMYGTSCDASGNIGFSLLCSGVRRLSQVENLLSSEYVRSEAVVVGVGLRRPGVFGQVVGRHPVVPGE